MSSYPPTAQGLVNLVQRVVPTFLLHSIETEEVYMALFVNVRLRWFTWLALGFMHLCYRSRLINAVRWWRPVSIKVVVRVS